MHRLQFTEHLKKIKFFTRYIRSTNETLLTLQTISVTHPATENKKN